MSSSASFPMSFPASFPACIPVVFVDTVIGLLLPWLLTAAGGDVPAARAAAIELLAEAQAQTGRELRLAGEVIVHSLKAMALLSGTTMPGGPADTADPPLKAASSLARHSHLAQRRLDELQRARRAEAKSQPANAAAAPQTAPLQAAPLQPAAPPAAATPAAATPAAAPRTVAPTLPAASTSQAILVPQAEAAPSPGAAPSGDAWCEVVPAEISEAEVIFANAAMLLNQMKAHWKDPQPHTKAAQDIQQQQRVVDAALTALSKVRRRHAAVAA